MSLAPDRHEAHDRGRALFILTSDRMGGAERVTATLAREAARSGLFDGIDVFVLAWSRSGTLDDLERRYGVQLHYTNAQKEHRAVLSLLSFLAFRRYQLVFSSATHLNAACSLMRRLGLLRVKRLISRESTLIFERDFGRRGMALRLLYRLYGAQDVIVCQTERMRASLDASTGRRFSRKWRVVPNPIDGDRIEAGVLTKAPPELREIPADRIRIAWCGRLSQVKSPLRAIGVLRSLHDRGLTAAHLIVIGDGPLLDEMVTKAADENLTKAITFVGHQPNPVAFMASAQLGLITSDIEGFPNVILEMLGAGVNAIVTTNCAGGLQEIPGVYVAPERSVAALTDTLLKVDRGRRDPRISKFLDERSPSAFLQATMDVGHDSKP